MSVAILSPGSRTRRFSKRLTQVLVTLFGLGMMLAVKYLIDEKRKRRAAVQNVSVSVEEDGAAGKA
jgi:hypothetical protein